MRLLPAIVVLLLFSTAQAQQKITIIDLYGNHTIPATRIREQLGIREGDTVRYEAKDLLIKKIKKIPGVKNADISMVCCDPQTSGGILFVGIDETGNATFTHHPAPARKILLPAPVTATYRLQKAAMEKAVREGRSQEDDSQGHALLIDSATRALQLRFVDYARQYLPQLKEALYQSADAGQRAIAAEVIAYTTDKKAVVADLLYAVQDPDEQVRNNATRALGVMANYSNTHPLAAIPIPATLFIRMLHSISWTDRNKASMVLFSLTQSRDTSLLHTLKQEAFPALCQMAHWKSQMHALFPYLIIARISGVPDDDAYQAIMAANRDTLLDDMISRIRTQ